MTTFKSRLSKLEEVSRARNGSERIPGIPAEMMIEARRVAAVCGTWQELAGYLTTLLPKDQRDVVPIDDGQRRDAVLGAAARLIMEEVNALQPLHAG